MCAVVIAVVTLGVSTIPVSALQAYGYDAYGNCIYAEGCNSVLPPTTLVPINPSPQNPTSGRVVSVNITNNQVFTEDAYVVVVTPNFPFDQIARVLFYQGEQLIGEALQPVGESYRVVWNLPDANSYIVRVVVVLRDGSQMEQAFAITVREGGMPVANIPSDTQNQDMQEQASIWSNQSFLSQGAGVVTDFVKKVIAATPPEVAYAVPYTFLTGLATLAAVLLLQTKSQLQYVSFLVAVLKKDKQLADEKTTFIMLVSHHLRTPLTIIKSSLELALMDDTQNTELLAAQSAANKLHAASEAILSDIEDDHYLKHIVAPDVSKVRLRLYRSWRLLLPALLSLILLVGANIVYIAAGKTEVIIPNIVLQIILSVTLLVLIMNLIQRRQQRIEQRGRLMLQRDHQLALDKARNDFIKRTTKDMAPLLVVLKEKCQSLKKRHDTDASQSAVQQLGALIERFELASELERGKIAASLSEFDLGSMLHDAVRQLSEVTARRKLTVKTAHDSLTLHHNEFFVRYVLNTLLDNAVRYAQSGSTVTAAISGVSAQDVSVYIKNQGEGIAPEKLAYLFQPFSSSSNVEIFSEQGIGLNLYLSRLIMRYIGGDVILQSEPGKTTTAIMKLPLTIAT